MNSVFVQTYGCQMNERDSEEVLGMLTAQGYEIADRAEAADVILLNTCSVRQHAEERAIGKMGELSELKRERPDLVLGIIGCMAKLQQELIFKRLPKVDLVAGPAELYDLPYLLAEIHEKRQQAQESAGGWVTRSGGPQPPAADGDASTPRGGRRGAAGGPASFLDAIAGKQAAGLRRTHPLADGAPDRVLAVGRPFRPLDQKPAGDYRTPGVSAFVTIMEGCDKACTYCIVPKTRGQEISRPAEEIVREVQALEAAGYKQVTLLGQNVNSYGKRFPDGSGFRGPLGRLKMLQEDPDSLLDFPNLLRLLDQRTAIGRIRFTTSHPFDATDRLFQAMADCPSVCEWLHLPVQSGSNRMLRAMRRGYTAEAYLRKIESLRRLVPGICLSTDIIVGFPGETDEDFQATVRLLREVRYANAYVFKYSPRPGTDAAAREDDVPPEVKDERNQLLLALQQQILTERYQALVGQEVEILIEGPGKQPGQWFGRTAGNDGVIIEHAGDLLGQTLVTRIVRAGLHTLFAELLQPCHCATASGPGRHASGDANGGAGCRPHRTGVAGTGSTIPGTPQEPAHADTH